ncbi:hypothetical protein [Nitrosopumilus spindle-shaped virus]|uniref:Transmembrane protein n=1 Tax=Nitrosopumilus spindle-shaped virus TaxID=2508184 RepID=A0A514K3A3_9VIRU|nr:hypothetical protein [Nitrosopumilus spindle-shaped virus]
MTSLINYNFFGLLVMGFLVTTTAFVYSEKLEDNANTNIRSCNEIFDRHDQGIEKTTFKSFEECEKYVSSFKQSLLNSSYALKFGGILGIGLIVISIIGIFFVKESENETWKNQ